MRFAAAKNPHLCLNNISEHDVAVCYSVPLQLHFSLPLMSMSIKNERSCQALAVIRQSCVRLKLEASFRGACVSTFMTINPSRNEGKVMLAIFLAFEWVPMLKQSCCFRWLAKVLLWICYARTR